MKKRLIQLLSSTSLLSLSAFGAAAQITTDGTTATTCNGGACAGATGNVTLDGGLIAGSNQFHSFSDFNVSSGGSATFTYSGAGTIQNVIARVTGANVSSIDGQLSNAITDASLFLINPNGMVFGENASIAGSGAVYLSTADTLGFADATTLRTDLAPGSTFSTAAPQSFGFLGGNADITGSGALNFAPGTTSFQIDRLEADAPLVQFSAPNISFTNQMAQAGPLYSNAGSTLELLAVGSQTSLLIEANGAHTGLDGTLSFNTGGVDIGLGNRANLRAGSITFVNDSLIQLLGAEDSNGTFGGFGAVLDVAADTFLFDTRSTVTADVNVFNTILLGEIGFAGVADTTPINLDFRIDGLATFIGPTTPAGFNWNAPGFYLNSGTGLNFVAGDISATNFSFVNFARFGRTAGSVTLSGGLVDLQESTISTGADEGSEGGSVSIIGDDIVLDGVLINADTSDTGNAGSILLDASGTLTIDNSTISSVTRAAGQGGEITLNATGSGSITGTLISSTTEASGRAGDISFNVVDLSLETSTASSESTLFTTGNAGNINVVADTVDLNDMSVLRSSTSGQGTGGIISVAASSLQIRGQADLAATSSASGNAGSVEIDVDTLSLRESGGISTEAVSAGDSGSINISANTIDMTSFGRITARAGNMNGMGTGNGADVTIVTDQLNMIGNATISSDTEGGGDAGNIFVTANSIVMDGTTGDPANVLSISTGSDGIGEAGDITLTAASISLTEGQIAAATLDGGSGNAGDITLNTQNLDVGSIGGVLATSTGAGSAGRITVNAAGGTVNLHDGGELSNTGTGSGGSQGVELTATELQMSNGAAILSSTRNGGTAGDIDITVTTANLSGNDTGLDPLSSIASDTDGVGNAGSVTLTAEQLVLENGFQISTASDGSIDPLGTGNAGNIQIAAMDATISDASRISSETSTAGSGGNIEFDANSLEMTNSALISSRSFGSGNAGTLSISASDIRIADSGLISSETFASGSGGLITIDVGNLLLETSGSIAAGTLGGSGAGGSIDITAGDITLREDGSIGLGTDGAGDAGSLTIAAESVALTNGGAIGANSGGAVSAPGIDPTGFTGSSGTISITANSLVLSGRSSSTGGFSFIDSISFANGNAGDITINVDSLLMDDGASLQNSSASYATDAIGNAGNISITANSIEMSDGSGLTSSSSTAGRAGTISLTVRDQLTLTNSSFGSETQTSGLGGSIIVQGASEGEEGQLMISLTDAFITTNTRGSGDAGSIEFFADRIDANSSTIQAATSGSGAAGSIGISAADTILFDGRTGISSNTDSEGNAGNIHLTAPNQILIVNESFVQTNTSGSGDGGEVAISTDTLTLREAAGINLGADASGNGGSLTVDARLFQLLDGGAVNANSGGAIGANTNGVFDPSLVTGSGGSISIEADQLILQGTGLNGGNSFIDSIAFGDGDAGDIVITVRDLQMADNSRLATAASSSFETALANAGDITVTADLVSIGGSSSLTSAVDQGVGRAGTILLTVSDLLSMTDGSLSTDSGLNGQGGSILIQGGAAPAAGSSSKVSGSLNVALEDSFISASGRNGTAGSIEIVSQSISSDNSSIQASTSGSGNAGSITLSTSDSILLDNDSQVESETTGAGNAGNITLSAATSIGVDNGSVVRTNTFASGNGGQLLVEAPSALLSIGPRSGLGAGANSGIGAPELGAPGSIIITVSSLEAIGTESEFASIAAVNEGGRNGGIIRINTNDLTVSDGQIDTFALSSGAAADIELNVVDSISLRSNSSINVGTFARGVGGNIVINAPNAIMQLEDSFISAATCSNPLCLVPESEAGSPGSITLDVESLLLDNSTIFAGTNSDADARSVRISADSLLLENGSSIANDTSGAGAGGNVILDISGDASIMSSSRLLAGTGGFGPAGSIELSVLGDLLVDNGEISVQAAGTAASGSIRIVVDGEAIVQNDSVIESAALGGNAGQVVFESLGGVQLTSGSTITSNSNDAEAGDITVSLGPNQFLILQDAQITTSGSQTGGTVSTGGQIVVTSLDANQPLGGVVLLNSVLEALGDGTGALLSIDQSGLLLFDQDSQIAVSGTVDTPENQFSEDQEELNDDFLSASDVLATQCAGQKSGQGSIFSFNEDMGLRTDKPLPQSPLRGPELYSVDDPELEDFAALLEPYREDNCG